MLEIIGNGLTGVSAIIVFYLVFVVPWDNQGSDKSD